MNPNEIGMYYPSGEVETDGGALPQFTVSQNSSSLVRFAWNDTSGLDRTFALGFFDSDTESEELRGVPFSIRSASSSYIIVSQPLPAYPSQGDTFRIVQGIRFASNQKVPSSLLNGQYAELLGGVSSNIISGVTIKSASSEVDLYLCFDYEASHISISNDNENWGIGVMTNSGDVTDGYLQTPDGQWVVIDVDVLGLPDSTTTELVMVSNDYSDKVTNMWLDSSVEDSVVHNFLVLRNESSETIVFDIVSEDDIGTASVGAAYTDGDNTMILEDVDGLPGKDFWIYRNETPPDIRYVSQRAGNTCYLADTSDWQEVGFVNGSESPLIGTSVEAAGVSGILRGVYLTSGSWAVGDAAGVMILSDSDGVFLDGGEILQGSVSVAEVDGDGVYKLRGITKQSAWNEGDDVLWYPGYDAALLSPGAGSEFDSSLGARSESGFAFLPWTYDGGEYKKNLSFSFTSASLVSIGVRRYLLRDMVGNLEIEIKIKLSWE
jgi:hypothetical protein